MTSRGFKEKEFVKVAHWIHEALTYYENESELERIREEVVALTSQFPVRGDRI